MDIGCERTGIESYGIEDFGKVKEEMVLGTNILHDHCGLN